MAGTPHKRQKREDYRKAQQSSNGTTALELPKKKFYRQRAHANPFSDHNLVYPRCPAEMDWGVHYPAFLAPEEGGVEGDGKGEGGGEGEEGMQENGRRKLTKQVTVADVGCGFGGLLVALSPLMPEKLMIGMELRTQVTDYVNDRIAALRSQNQRQGPTPASSIPTTPGNPSPGQYANISALRTNTMKFLPNYFVRGQLTHLFLCFPDPHFKARKHKARIVSQQLNAEYAYVVRPGGRVYTITDVEELHSWIVGCFEGEKGGDGRELWGRVMLGEDGAEGDECVRVMREETEEGKKVGRNGGRKFVGVWERREDPAWV